MFSQLLIFVIYLLVFGTIIETVAPAMQQPSVAAMAIVAPLVQEPAVAAAAVAELPAAAAAAAELPAVADPLPRKFIHHILYIHVS